MKERFDFVFSGRIKFGCGSRSELPELLAEHGYNNICVVVDEALSELEIVVQLLDSLPCKSLVKIVCDISEPTYKIRRKAFRQRGRGRRSDWDRWR